MAQFTINKVAIFALFFVLLIPFALTSPIRNEVAKRQAAPTMDQTCALAANSTDPAIIAAAAGRGCPGFTSTVTLPSQTSTTAPSTTTASESESEYTWEPTGTSSDETTSSGSSEPTGAPVPPGGSPYNSYSSWWEYIRNAYGWEINEAAGITGSIFIVLGVYFMVFGYRVFRITLGAIGFVVFSTLTWISLTNAEPASEYGNQIVVYLSVCICLGVLGAIVFMFFWVIAIYFVGGVSCFLFGLWLLGWREDHLVTNEVARVCILLGFFLIGVVIAFFNEFYVIIGATSFTGAWFFMYGLDLFVRVGLVNSVRDILDGNPNHDIDYVIKMKEGEWRVYLMMCVVIVLWALSAAWQAKWNQNRKFGVNHVKA